MTEAVTIWWHTSVSLWGWTVVITAPYWLYKFLMRITTPKDKR